LWGKEVGSLLGDGGLWYRQADGTRPGAHWLQL